jgi:hypothetical protein
LVARLIQSAFRAAYLTIAYSSQSTEFEWSVSSDHSNDPERPIVFHH